ncbi:ribonuclease domain-containing protein [Staphylococcus chromogenes]|nr:ribonuclease domain-containing protein [Staphylococcus chromogenes]
MAAKNKALAGLGGLAVVLVASFFGLDLDDRSYSGNHTQQTTAAVAPSQQKKPEKSSPKQETKTSSGLKACPVATLPDQARDVIKDIKAGGPFAYPDNDGVHFGNFERALPQNDYREYTVETPGLRHRGAQRIVTGGGTDKNPDTWFYTSDHYETFCEIPDAE